MSEDVSVKDITENIPHTLKEAADEFLLYLSSVRALSQNTVTAYTEDFKHLFDCLGQERELYNVSTEDLRFCIASLSKKKFSSASINRFIAAIRGLFAYCKRFKYISKNPALELKTVKIPKHLPSFMTQNEFNHLVESVSVLESPRKLWPARDRALFEMLYSSGCRVAEMASLTFSNISFDYKSAMIRGKGKKDRRVYFEKDAVDSLKKYLEERKLRFPQSLKGCVNEVDSIFINQKGSALSVKGIWYIVSKYASCAENKLSISPHSFRHSFATAMLSNGADIRYVQAMLGHSSLSTTQRYTHLTKEQLKETYRQSHPHSGKKD